MKKRLFSILQYVIFLGLGAFLIWWQFKDMTPADKKDFWNALHRANYWLIIPVVIMALLSHLSRAVRWKILIASTGHEASVKNTFSTVMVGYLANSAFPRLGEILKCTLLSRYEKIPADKLIGTILVERTFDLVCYIIFIAITILIQVDVVGSFVESQLSQMGHVWILLGIVTVCIIAFILIFKWLGKMYPKNKVFSAVRNFERGIKDGFLAVRHLKNRGWFLAHTFFIWAMYLLQIYLGFQAMKETQHASLSAACSVLTLATLAMIVTPGGIGTFPYFVKNVLVLYAVNENIGKSFGWLLWGVSTSIMVITGFICLMILPYLNRHKKNNLHETGQLHSTEST